MRIPGAAQANSVWSYDFVHDKPANGSTLKMLCVLDEHTRECLAIEVGKSLRNQDVILSLLRLMRLYRKPAFTRSDNGAEFTSQSLDLWCPWRHAACGCGGRIAVVSVELMPRILKDIAPWKMAAAFLLGAAASVAMVKGVNHAVRSLRLVEAGPWRVYVAIAIDLAGDALMIGYWVSSR